MYFYTHHFKTEVATLIIEKTKIKAVKQLYCSPLSNAIYDTAILQDKQ